MSDSKPKMPPVPPVGKTLKMGGAMMRNPILDLDEPSVHMPAPVHHEDEFSLDELVLEEASLSMALPKGVTAATPPAQTMKRGPGPRRPSVPPPAPPGTRPSMPPPAPKSKPTGKPIQVKSGLIGQILVDSNLISEQQRDLCLKLQAQSGNFFKLGELAVKNGFVTQQDLERAIKAQRRYVNGIKKEQSRMVKLPEEVAKVAALPVESDSGQDRLYKWLGSALRHGASDLHVMTDQPLILRHMGRLVVSKQAPVSLDVATETLQAILSTDEKNRLEQERSVTKCFDIKGGGRARCNIFYHMDGLNGTFRLIPNKLPSLVSLNLPGQLAKFTSYAQGLVLLTGSIGCGKTSTMAALVDILNKERRHHIITIERPVEFIHKSARSLVTQREVGVHTTNSVRALRAALREDPDVIAVGDMNDLETARLTLTAAETGHLVFATLHTDNAVRTINRVLDIFPPDEQGQIRTMLSESLRGVVCQRLVQRADEPGLIPVVEMLFTTPAIRNLIREQKVYQIPNAIKMSRDLGNCTFEDHAAQLLSDEVISKEVAALFGKEEA